MARKIWINTSNTFILHTGEFENPPKHYNVSIAAGHVLPMDDFVNSKDMPISLETYELIDPEMNKTELAKPVQSDKEVINTDTGVAIEHGDVAAHKISINDDSVKGTYQVAASTEELLFDVQGWKGQPVKSKAKYYAKSFLKVGEWTQPQPLGHEFELIPHDDLGDVRVGDPVTFEASFLGEPFTCTGSRMEYLIAASNTYGGEAGGDLEGHFLAAYLVNGKARFRFPTSGQWIIAAFNFRDVSPENELKEFSKDCSRIFYHTTLTLNVKA